MVHMMRGDTGIDELTFVAELDGKIVGHIIFTKDSYILQEDGSKVEVLNFGPISVSPEFQKQGIGKALMNHSMQWNYKAVT